MRLLRKELERWPFFLLDRKGVDGSVWYVLYMCFWDNWVKGLFCTINPQRGHGRRTRMDYQHRHPVEDSTSCPYQATKQRADPLLSHRPLRIRCVDPFRVTMLVIHTDAIMQMNNSSESHVYFRCGSYVSSTTLEPNVCD